MKTPTEIQSALRNFSGSEQWHRWSVLFPKDLLTDGAQFVAEECQAYWLMDLIASHQIDPKVRREDFQVWKLVNSSTPAEPGWDVTAEDGNDHEVARQSIGFSDFPLPSIVLWAARNELGGMTIMLPGEY